MSLIDKIIYMILVAGYSIKTLFEPKKKKYHIKRHTNDPDFDVYIECEGELKILEKDVPCFLMEKYL